MSRIVTIYYDVNENVLRNSSGEQIRKEEYPFIIYKEKPIVNLYLVTDSSLTAYTGLGAVGEVYSASIDSDFDHSTGLMCKTLDANINKAGDWQDDSDGTADPGEGEFSIRLNANNSTFQTKVGTSEEKTNTVFELQAFDSAGGDLIFVRQIPFRCYNIVDDDGSVPPGLDSQYVSFGTVTITSGLDYVTVTGLGLASAPAQIICTVRKPNDSSVGDDFNIFATVRNDSISTDGFIADLSAQVDLSSYKLDYMIKLS